MSSLKVLVVGASIAGPTAAYWLAKAGAQVTVIERFPELRTSGQGIDIRTAGVSVMRKMPGMEAAVRAKKTTLEGISIVSESGRPYGVLGASGDPDQQSLVSEYEIFRGDLSQIIYDLGKDNKNIKYVFGEQVESMQHHERDDGPIKVEFKNGLATQQFDLVVACDGATSRTRAMGLGCGVRDHILPTNSWAAYYSMEQDLLRGGKIGLGYSAPGGRFVAIGPDPSGTTRVTMITQAPKNGPDITVEFRAAMNQGDTGLKDYVAKHYEGNGWRTEELIQGMMETDDFYANEIVQVKTPTLYRGRFVMVGDAGYCPGPTGSGTTLALAGAYLLAGEVCKNRDNLDAALQGYEQQVRPLITDMQKIPPFIHTFMAPQTSWGIWIRNMIFAFITWSNIVNFLQSLLGGALGSGDKYPMPDYNWVA